MFRNDMNESMPTKHIDLIFYPLMREFLMHRMKMCQAECLKGAVM